ncbi:OLC1v1023978C2 [Oldenlandia corymbosa var. corymbosa]|uniref:tRNA-uridine aminocarboxypropyltransferase n=1 Tax=Oldenlandia corymbosa var. corymbosa TaxID=529605 RepID=A0AAV1C424_OLDCO|nr:OLC1v1023978C2 [Oldenlandia corymbosa var. corymbosa]
MLSRPLCFKACPLHTEQLKLLTQINMDSRPVSASRSAADSPVQDSRSSSCNGDAAVSLQEWQNWGAISPVPAMVTEVIEDLNLLEKDMNTLMDFGGNHGSLRGNFKVQEDKKHRAKFQSLGDSEKKLQFFSARQIACRLLGSRGYLCQKCWLPMEDCMCSRIKHCSLWHRIRFWLYMHPKDFLRQNNTGKVLWQVFGNQAATLCLYGISELEEIMWDSFKLAGRRNVWCLYPNKNAVPMSVQDAFVQDSSRCPESENNLVKRDDMMNFILLDGTWSNSQAMFNRLQDRAEVVWGEDLPCISLNAGVSSMHKLRPQPSWDRTCTAAAAVRLLDELELIPEFSSHGLRNQAIAIKDALEVLLEALTTRRLRMGRSISRKERHNASFC